MFRITIVEVFPETQTPSEVKRYEQTVDVVDMKKIIAAINSKPRGPRGTKVKP